MTIRKHVTIICNMPGCHESATSTCATVNYAREDFSRIGWRRRKVGDVCPECASKPAQSSLDASSITAVSGRGR